MIVSVNDQALTFLLAVGVGVVLGIIYDLIRVFRRIIRHSNIVINIEDLIYWIICALVIFYAMFNKNYGEIRGFVLLGVAIGAILYFLMLSKYLIKVIMIIVNIIKLIIITIFKIVFTPIKIIIKLFIMPINILNKLFLKTIIKPIKNGLTKTGKRFKIKRRQTKKDIQVIKKKI